VDSRITTIATGRLIWFRVTLVCYKRCGPQISAQRVLEDDSAVVALELRLQQNAPGALVKELLSPFYPKRAVSASFLRAFR
jgi:hypothetical protein